MTFTFYYHDQKESFCWESGQKKINTKLWDEHFAVRLISQVFSTKRLETLSGDAGKSLVCKAWSHAAPLLLAPPADDTRLPIAKITHVSPLTPHMHVPPRLKGHTLAESHKHFNRCNLKTRRRSDTSTPHGWRGDFFCIEPLADKWGCSVIGRCGCSPDEDQCLCWPATQHGTSTKLVNRCSQSVFMSYWLPVTSHANFLPTGALLQY